MPITGLTPLTIRFVNLSSADTYAWYWTFGDGGSSIAFEPTYTYVTPGTYTVTLWSTSKKGTVRQTDTVTVGVAATDWTAPTADADSSLGSNPEIMLRISNDAGKTWITEQWRSAGKTGEWLKRVRWNRLGAARRRVFEVVVTDAVPWRLTGAYLKVSNSSASRGVE